MIFQNYCITSVVTKTNNKAKGVLSLRKVPEMHSKEFATRLKKRENENDLSPNSNSSSSADRFRCPHPECNKTFSRQEHLSRHKLNHWPKEIYVCSFVLPTTNAPCNKTFVRKDLLIRHEKRHSKMKNRLTGPNRERISSADNIFSKQLPYNSNETLISGQPSASVVNPSKNSVNPPPVTPGSKFLPFPQQPQQPQQVQPIQQPQVQQLPAPLQQPMFQQQMHTQPASPAFPYEPRMRNNGQSVNQFFNWYSITVRGLVLSILKELIALAIAMIRVLILI